MKSKKASNKNDLLARKGVVGRGRGVTTMQFVIEILLDMIGHNAALQHRSHSIFLFSTCCSSSPSPSCLCFVWVHVVGDRMGKRKKKFEIDHDALTPSQ